MAEVVPGWTPPGGMPRVDTVRLTGLVVTVVTPGIPVMEKSSVAVVARDLLLTILLTMYCTVVELRDCTGWIEKNPLFAPDVTNETVVAKSIWFLLRIQNWEPAKLLPKKSLAPAANLSSLTPIIGWSGTNPPALSV